jgi:hypothetical protein
VKLDEITIHQFRGLRDLALSGLSRVNLLVGPNDSGKTSILEAVAAFSRPLDVRVWVNATWRREVFFPEEGFAMWLEWMFPHEPGSRNGSFSEAETRISGSGTLAVREVRAHYKRLSRVRARPPEAEKSLGDFGQADYEQAGVLFELSASYANGNIRMQPWELWYGEELKLTGVMGLANVPCEMITPVSHRVETDQLRWLSEASIADKKHGLLALIQAIDSEIRDVQILSPSGKRPVIYIDFARVGFIPLSACGDGIRRALFIALGLQSTAGGILLIDEIEASIHVTALGPMFSWIVRSCEQLDIQLFATTHSLEAVDAMIQAEAGSLSSISGYRLRRINGVVEAQRVDGDLLGRLRNERGLDVRL